MPRQKPPSEPPSVTVATEPEGSPLAMEQPTILSTAQGCVFGYWRNVIIQIWAARADLELIGEVERTTELVARAHGKHSVVVLTLGESPLPTPEARAVIQRMTARYGKQTIATSILLGATGFWASAVLGFVTSVQALQSKHMRIKTFSSMDELIPWTVTSHNAESSQPIDANDLREVLKLALARSEVKPRG
jgi:hypothetical protein